MQEELLDPSSPMSEPYTYHMSWARRVSEGKEYPCFQRPRGEEESEVADVAVSLFDRLSLVQPSLSYHIFQNSLQFIKFSTKTSVLITCLALHFLAKAPMLCKTHIE